MADDGTARTDQPSVLDDLAEFISRDDFVCLGARAALRRGSIVNHHYGELAPTTVAAHHDDLLTFLKEFTPTARSFGSFVATFAAPLGTDEPTFERRIWRYLQALHDLDSEQYDWSTEYASDPSSDRFAFSVGGHPFFLVGLHPGASRPSRRFRLPTIVFNSHLQFNAMGMNFLRLRTKIRARERSFHGAVNPSFVKYRDEARHYGGRFTEPDWQCPFRPRT